MVEVIPAQKLSGRVQGVFHAPRQSFETEPVEALTLGYEGIPGDRHSGLLRRSGPREPWYQRGLQMRNERQLSILGAEELADVAQTLGIDRLEPEWIGGNIVLNGVPSVSLLPPRTLLIFEGGATVRIDGDNAPCRKSGQAIAKRIPGREDIEFSFVKAAQCKRGVVGWVERAGVVRPGESVTVRIWKQWIYPPSQGRLAV